MLTFINFIFLLLVAGYGLYLFGYLLFSRVSYIKLGKKVDFDVQLKERLNTVLINVFGQSKLFKDKKSGIMHFVLFYGFIIIQVGLIEIILKGFFKGYELPLGDYHKYFSFFQEWTVFLMLVAVIYAFYRRYGEKLTRLQWKRDGKALFVYIGLTILTVSIFFMLAFETLMIGKEPNLAFAPFSGILASAFGGISESASTVLFYIFWWTHILIVFGFMVFVPQSKQAHEVFAAFNVFFKKAGPVGKLSTIDFENEEVEEFGVGKIEDFTRQQLIDLYACAECGRCTNMCPASGTGKTLSPMDLIVKMRNHLTEKGAVVTSLKPWVPGFVFKETKGNQLAIQAAGGATIELPNLIGDVITEEEIWACTTCRNCEDQCPVSNEHVDKIIDLRRYLVMTQGEIPADASRYMTNIERQSNPWGINRKNRVNWREGMEDIVKTVDETDDFEYLLWVGSMGSFDNRSQKIIKSLSRILHKAGVKFAILGNEERSSGDTVRRLGNEYLFQSLCAENVEIFNAYNVRKIVTIDPHAFNTFKHEYPEFGFEGEVYHHTQLLSELLREGKITPTKEVKEQVVYHDSCYIGRYNNIFDLPRDILKAIPGVEILEMERNKQDALCCGAGGGRMWMEEKEGTRINVARTEMALKTNPSVIGSNCPYCLTMMSDGVKAHEKEESIQTLDITELLEQSLA